MAITKVSNELIAVNAIQGTLIADNAITAVHIATNAVSGTLIADNAVTAVHIATDAVTPLQIQADAVTAAKLATNAVVTASIVAGSVTATELGADAVTAAKIGDDVIDSEHYAAGSIDASHLADDAVTIAKMAALTRGSIIAGDSSGAPAALAVGSANTVLKSDGTDASYGTIATANIAADAITGAKIADDAIDSEHYADGSIDNAHIADDAIDSEHYADGSIDLAHMSSQSVDEDNLYISNSGSNGQFLSKQSGNSGGLTWAAAGADFDTAITINDSGADVDFRIESDDQTHMFFVDGGNDKIGVGTAAPSTRLEIYGNDNQLSVDGASNANIALFFKEAGTIKWELYHRGSSDDFRIYNGANTSFDMAIKSDGKVGFGTVSPTTNLTAATSANILQTALTSSSNAIAWDAIAKANTYHVTTENTTFSAPTNAVEGAIISVEIAQGGTARTIAWNTVFEFAASTAPTITATASKTDILTFRYNGSVWQEIGRVQNMAQT